MNRVSGKNMYNIAMDFVSILLFGMFELPVETLPSIFNMEVL